MDLTTTYLGMELAHPLVPSAAQPLTRTLDHMKRLEDAGAAAIVMHSLFEEQIELEAKNLSHFLEKGTESYAEALSYYPAREDYVLGPDEYLEQLRRAKEQLSIPVLGSLNGVSVGGWTAYAEKMELAGADAIELNVYYLPTDPHLIAESVEKTYLGILGEVREKVSIPVTMKLGPYFSSLVNFARRLEAAGANGLALFNRFYQPDLDIEKLEVVPRVNFSTSDEILLPLRWIGILRDEVNLTLAATSGVHTTEDALKLVMAGADVVHMCSALIRHGPERLTEVRDGMARWLEEHEYESLAQARGSLSQAKCAEPAAFERANYMKTIHSVH